MPEMFGPLRHRLLTAGIAPRHARRYVAELRDHAADLAEEERRAGLAPDEARSRALARLGTADDLVRAMIARGDFRSWGARAPWAVYGLGSLLGLAMIYGLVIATVAIIVETHRPSPDARPVLPIWFDSAFATITYVHGLALPLLLAALFAIMATRQRMAALWPSIALLVVGVIGGAGTFDFIRPADPDGIMELELRFTLAPPWPGLGDTLRHIAINLLLTLAPYLAWRAWQKALAECSDGGDDAGFPLTQS
ncbi:permease prefix domain 1-containing protein [Nitrospirillum sp. BR 11163]|uniref:permease prefix domain 1-containing protein n=1 Tax=Nitrospirillum sp. BR 11163 TaxID=3104323 RepID=UPI002AFE69DA|nr:permease prefix domain 1-containing protein [Nitrospirillum sp. BR 11163]MEA1674780.1 permease prefix domain 1-containing protein [Nitrospirillum sp. BR 11163]